MANDRTVVEHVPLEKTDLVNYWGCLQPSGQNVDNYTGQPKELS